MCLCACECISGFSGVWFFVSPFRVRVNLNSKRDSVLPPHTVFFYVFSYVCLCWECDHFELVSFSVVKVPSLGVLLLSISFGARVTVSPERRRPAFFFRLFGAVVIFCSGKLITARPFSVIRLESS